MNIIRRTLEIDAGTDARLTEMAAERGQEVSAVLAEAVALLDSVSELATLDIAEDRRRLDEFLLSHEAVPLADAKVWVASWDSPEERPLPSPRNWMIVLSSDALADVERLRTLLDEADPGAARRAMAVILVAIERLQEFPDLGMATSDVDIRQIVVRFGAVAFVCGSAL